MEFSFSNCKVRVSYHVYMLNWSFNLVHLVLSLWDSKSHCLWLINVLYVNLVTCHGESENGLLLELEAVTPVAYSLSKH